LEEDIAGARGIMDALARAGISMKAATDKLTEDGVKLFAEAFDKLLAAVTARTRKAAPRP
jgi:transaldolase/glucose-6-phosphate isomerase